MTSLRCYTALLLTVSAFCAGAAPTYSVPWLGRLAEQAGIALPDSMEADTDNDSTWSYRNRPLRVRTNAYGDVSHIGYKLFDTHWAATHDARPLLDFLERYAFEEDVLPPEDKAEATSRKAIDFLEGNATMLKLLTPSTPFRIDEQERRGYLAEWDTGSERVRLRVSADCQTLLGANLIELEEMLERDLLRTPAGIVPDTLPAAWQGCTISKADRLAVADGGTFLSEMIRSRVYLRTDGQGTYRLLADDTEHPLPSINNLLLTGCSRRTVPVHLTLDKYGDIKRPLTVTMQQFVRYCTGQGCRLYVGIKERTDAGLSATLFAVNTKLAYCHTLSVYVPLSLLQGTGSMTGTLYAFTPLQDITEKFFITNP